MMTVALHGGNLQVAAETWFASIARLALREASRRLSEHDSHGLSGWDRLVPEVGGDAFASVAWASVYADSLTTAQQSAFAVAVELFDRLAGQRDDQPLTLDVSTGTARQVVAAAQITTTVISELEPVELDDLPALRSFDRQDRKPVAVSAAQLIAQRFAEKLIDIVAATRMDRPQ